jgi:hypothetical protein
MKRNNIFWIGYSDLMTSMFFIMLVLFILSIGYLEIRNRELEIKNHENEKLIAELKKSKEGLIKERDRANKLLNLEKQFKPLIDNNYFYYLRECNKFFLTEFMGIEMFKPGETEIKNDTLINIAVTVGRNLEYFLETLSGSDEELSYLLIIEGNMANTYDKEYSKDNNYGYRTSYQRALTLYNLWISNGIDFRKSNVEVLICGSGFNGVCRDEEIEENNKRFSIQIIPKVSK